MRNFAKRSTNGSRTSHPEHGVRDILMPRIHPTLIFELVEVLLDILKDDVTHGVSDILPIVLLLRLLIMSRLLLLFLAHRGCNVVISVSSCTHGIAHFILLHFQLVREFGLVLDEVVADVQAAAVAKAVGVVGGRSVGHGAESSDVGVAEFVGLRIC
jgi:hypothetical protein